ncbi:putative DsbA family dithiol-disulfide isomerase [Streptacidiphilus sp. BW17]|uniref:DsbA family oxidoreductase n=1 Tax=Streptacidiphilus sp. BW17 TaxID=3156274 RepID=UPI0035182384
MRMHVELWVDLVCPWCPIGRRRLERAVVGLGHRFEDTVSLRSLPLPPPVPYRAGRLLPAHVAAAGMTHRQVQQRIAYVTELAAAEGLEYHLDKARPVDTFDAHRLTHWADRRGLRPTLTERLARAFTGEGIDLSAHTTLAALAAEVGLDADEAATVLAGDAFADHVHAEERRARLLGAAGVPFLAVQGRPCSGGVPETDELARLLGPILRTLPGPGPADS